MIYCFKKSCCPRLVFGALLTFTCLSVSGETLKEARAAFHSAPQKTDYKPSGEIQPPLYHAYELVEYPAPVGKLAAYLSRDPGDGKKHPVVVWAHGGFGSIDPPDLLPQSSAIDQSPDNFRAAGFVVMTPSWRGENANPGHFELYNGEVDDLIAAVDYAKKLPYSDPNRVYLMGHSSGGTLVLLAAEKGVQVRAAFSFGGTPALERELKATNGSFYIYKLLPFNWRNPDELKIREPIHFVSDIRLPTFYVEGELVTSNASGAQLMAKVAKTAHASLDVHIINGGDHFNILRPIKRLIEEKLLRDTGTTFSVTLSDAEITKAFINCRDAKPEISDKPFVRASPDLAKILKRNVTAAIQEVPREIAFIRLALTADGAVYHSVDNAFDVGDRQCESNGVTFVLDPRAYETLAPLDLSIEVTDNRKHLQVKRHVKMD